MTSVLHGLTRGFAHGRAFTEVLPLANPAPGTELEYNPGGRYQERLVAVTFDLVTSATVASRQVNLIYRDAGAIAMAKIPAGGTQAASLTRTYCFLPEINAPLAVASSTFLAPLPGLWLQAGYDVFVQVVSIDATDQISNARFTVERFDTGPEGYPIGMVEETRAQATAERLGD